MRGVCDREVAPGEHCPVVGDYVRDRALEIKRLGWIKEEDGPAIQQLIMAEVQLRLLEYYFGEYGMVRVVRGREVIPQPAARLYDQLHKRLISLGDRLGLNPLARAKLEKERPSPLTPAELAGLLEDGDNG